MLSLNLNPYKNPTLSQKLPTGPQKAKSKEKNEEEAADLLLQAGLRALGSTGVVADLLAEADGHGDVTVIHRHHCHLLPGRPVRDAKTANVGLEMDKNYRDH